MDVVVIGGGVSGLVCAIRIKELYKDKFNVTIVERLEKVGKKILATGNGKCNFSNLNVDPKKYNNPKFVTPILDVYSQERVCNILEGWGLMYKELQEGRLYPYTEQASTVLEILRLKVNELGIAIKANYEVNKVTYRGDKYQIYNKNQRAYYIEADYVVFATGGKSAEILGSNGSGYDLLKGLKIKSTDVAPGLVGLKGDVSVLKQLNGLRFKCNVSLFNKKKKHIEFSEYGEVQFKNDGLSGIVVMQASSYIARNSGTYMIQLDFFKDKEIDELINIIKMRRDEFSSFEANNLFTGMLPKMLGKLILSKAGFEGSNYLKDLNDKIIKKMASLLKAFPVDIKGDYGFDKSQVTVGGIELSEIDNETLALKKLNHAYIVGELMNIDGECGGYNIHYAIASALWVAENINPKKKKISKEVKDNNAKNKKH